MRAISVCLAAVMLATTFLVGALAFTSKDSTAADLLGGKEVVDAIQQADKIEVFRLKDKYQQQKLSDYEVVSGPAKIDPKLTQELARVVTAHGSYEREIAKGCVPIYGVKATFTHGKTQIDVLFCFGCQIIEVFKDGKVVGGGNFDPSMKALTKIVQQAFPEDEAIQKIGKE